MRVLEIASLPSAPTAAAAQFYSTHLGEISAYLASSRGHLTVVLSFGDKDHDDWRRAAARDLAREHAPIRVNFVGGGDKMAQDKALAYLRNAPGVTGQYLPLS